MLCPINGSIIKGIEQFYKSLEIREKLKDSVGLAESYSNLGGVYSSQQKFEKALLYTEKSILIAEKVGLSHIVLTSLINSGALYVLTNNKDEALIRFEKALRLARKNKDKINIISTLNNIGKVYINEKKFKKSLPLFNEALDIAKKINFREGHLYALSNLAEVNYKMNNLSIAKKHATKVIDIADKIGNPLFIRIGAILKTRILQKEGNWKEAFTTNELYHTMKDSIQNSEIDKNLIEQKAQYDLNKNNKKLKCCRLKMKFKN